MPTTLLALDDLHCFAFATAAARQRLYSLDLFPPLLVEDGVPKVDVTVQARVRVVLVLGGWVRVGCGRVLDVHNPP